MHDPTICYACERALAFEREFYCEPCHDKKLADHKRASAWEKSAYADEQAVLDRRNAATRCSEFQRFDGEAQRIRWKNRSALPKDNYWHPDNEKSRSDRLYGIMKAHYDEWAARNPVKVKSKSPR